MDAGDQSAARGPFPLFAGWRSRGPILAVLLPLICFLPVLTGVLQRAFKGKFHFGDFQAMLCAGQRSLANLPVYAAEAPCPGLTGFAPYYPYPYAPWSYRAIGEGLGMVGYTPIWIAYIALYVVAVVFMIVAALRAGDWGKPWSIDRMANNAPLIAIWSGAPVTWGNIGLPLHGLVLACAFIAGRLPWLFVLVVAATAAIKPQMAAYAAVLVFAVRPFWKGAAYAALAAALGLAPTLYSLWVEPAPLVFAWREAVVSILERGAVGTGSLAWFIALGLDPFAASTQALALAFGAIIALGGLAFARAADLDARASALLGVAVVTLASPRLNDYDLLTIGPGLAVLLLALRDKTAKAFQIASALALAALLAPIVLDWLDLGRLGNHMRQLTLAAIVLAGGVGLSLSAARRPRPA